MNVAALAAEYENRPYEDLAQRVVEDYELTEALLSAHPEIAQDAGFELFDRRWAQRYWRAVVSELTGIQASEKLQSWAVNATISGVATQLIDHFGLPGSAGAAAVALAVILLRAARGSVDEAEPKEEPKLR
jgi:hypothetical protein